MANSFRKFLSITDIIVFLYNAAGLEADLTICMYQFMEIMLEHWFWKRCYCLHTFPKVGIMLQRSACFVKRYSKEESNLWWLKSLRECQVGVEHCYHTTQGILTSLSQLTRNSHNTPAISFFLLWCICVSTHITVHSDTMVYSDEKLDPYLYLLIS